MNVREMERRGMFGPSGAKAVPWYNAGGVDNTHIAAWQPMGAASLAASYLKLGGASFGNANLDPAVVGVGAAPTHAVPSGWTFNGIDQFLDSGLIPNGGNWSAAIRFTDAQATGGGKAFGAYGGSSAQFDFIPNNTAGKASYHNGGLTSVAPQMATGRVIIAGRKAWRNGVLDTDALVAWSGSLARNLFIGCGNNGSAVSFTGIKIQAIAFSDLTWTDAQALALDAAIAAITVPT